MQNFDNLSSLLKNPQAVALLQQMMNNFSINGDINNKNALNNANENNNFQNIQMMANMMSLLNNNSNPVMPMGNNNNVQSMMMLMNLMSQMQNNLNNNQNKITEKKQDAENDIFQDQKNQPTVKS